MYIIITILFIIVTILSIIVFKIYGLLSLLITVPLIIMYIKSNNIINILKKEKRGKDKYNLSERKEVEFVSSRDRKDAIKKTKKTKEVKEKEKENKKTKNTKNAKEEKGKKIADKSKGKSKNKKQTKSRRQGDNKSSKNKKGILRKILNIFLICCIIGVFAVAAFMIYIVVSTGDFDPEALQNQDQTIIYDKDGNEIATLGNEKRESVEYDDLPQVLDRKSVV